MVAFILDYARRLRLRPRQARSVLATALASTASAAAASATRREVGHNCQPLGLNGGNRRTDLCLSGPVVRIETPGAFHQSVPLLRRPGTPRDPLQNFPIPGPKARRVLGTQGLSQNRVIVDDDRRRRRRLRGAIRSGRTLRRLW
jgi:hypothetical protein